MKGREGIFPLYVSWWYGEAFVRFLNYQKTIFVYIFDLFSIEICLKTLFSVWRRDMIYYDDLSLSERLQAWTLNLASRFVGMIVKSITIFVYVVVSSVSFVASITAIFLWLSLPLLVIALIILGFNSLING